MNGHQRSSRVLSPFGMLTSVVLSGILLSSGARPGFAREPDSEPVARDPTCAHVIAYYEENQEPDMFYDVLLVDCHPPWQPYYGANLAWTMHGDVGSGSYPATCSGSYDDCKQGFVDGCDPEAWLEIQFYDESWEPTYYWEIHPEDGTWWTDEGSCHQE